MAMARAVQNDTIQENEVSVHHTVKSLIHTESIRLMLTEILPSKNAIPIKKIPVSFQHNYPDYRCKISPS